MSTTTTRTAFKDYCLDNKYTKWYFNIIDKALLRDWTKKTSPLYTEKHHIIPKSILKNNDTVLLTAREHFICHLLLPKMLSDNNNVYKMQKALWNISHTRNVKINSVSYKKIKENYSKNCSKFMAGENNPMYGKQNKGYKHTEEHKQYIKSLTTGENNPMYGKKHSENFYKIKSKFYNFTYKNEKIEVFNLRKFCRDNNLDQGAMTRVNKGKQITHKGYSK